MQAKYAIKVQAIRSKNQAPRFYVNFPLPLAAAIGLEAGETVEWELLHRRELHLVQRLDSTKLRNFNNWRVASELGERAGSAVNASLRSFGRPLRSWPPTMA